MTKSKREVDYLEKRMQRIRMTLIKLKQDTTQTLLTFTVDSRPKKIISQQDYNNDINITTTSGPHPSVEQQIQIDAMSNLDK